MTAIDKPLPAAPGAAAAESTNSFHLAAPSGEVASRASEDSSHPVAGTSPMGLDAPGYGEGDRCNRNGCDGTIDIHPSENCSCHIAPPCGSCTAPRGFCPECGWEEANEEVINDFVVQIDPTTGNYKSWEPRPLDPSKIDWHSRPHSNSSMIKEGVYPPSASREDVLKAVDGTFGGRFEHFGNGTFKYIAYTD